MPPSPRPRRSELATPASNDDMFAKAAASGADLVFLDLEDACAPAEREKARGKAARALRDLDWGRTTRAIRMNGIDTRWAYGDVIEVVTTAREALDVIIVPKVRRARDVWWVDTLLTQLEETLGLRKRIALEVLIEETEGLQHVDEIAAASDRLEAIIFGAGDFSASQGARVDTNFDPLIDFPGDIWHYARARIVVAARTAGVDAIDAPFPNYRDPEAYRVACDRAAAMGFLGKWAIHPSQVEIANTAFSPTPDEIAHAERLVAAYRAAESAGKGASGLDGMLVDAAHLRHAATVAKRAELLGLSGKERTRMTRQMTLVGFMQAGNVTVYSGSWRYPSADLGFLTMDYYTRIGKVLEEGKFDCVFFDDRLAMPGVYGDSVAEAVRYGARPVKLDLTAVLGGIIGATSRIGVGATYSTTYYQPYHVARTFATLDHLSGGRAAWNVVTSVNDSEAQNFGLSAAMDHDRRYDKADEFLRDRGRALGLVGRRRADHGQGDRRVRRPGQGPRDQPQGRVVLRPGPADRAPHPAGPAGDPAGRLVRARPGVRGRLGRHGLHRRPRPRGGAGSTTGSRRSRSPPRAATPTTSRSSRWRTWWWGRPRRSPRRRSGSSSTPTCTRSRPSRCCRSCSTTTSPSTTSTTW